MRGRSRANLGQGGFTLVELMVSLTVVSIAIAAAFTMAFSLSNGFRDHRQAISVESSTRIILDMIASGIRSASPGLSSGQVWDPCDPDADKNIDTIEVINYSDAPDELRMVHALGGAFAVLPTGWNLALGSIVVDDNSSFELDLWTPAVIVDPQGGRGILVEVRVSSLDPTTTLSVQWPGGCAGAPDATAYPVGSFVVRAVHMHYSVDPPNLMVDPDGPGPLPSEVMAEGVEDLQIAIGIEDGTDSGSLAETVLKTDDEWLYNDPGDSAPGLITAGQWRALRVTIVGIANRETRDTGTNTRPAVEDRAAATVTDPYRRRAFSTTVELRNFASSD